MIPDRESVIRWVEQELENLTSQISTLTDQLTKLEAEKSKHASYLDTLKKGPSSGMNFSDSNFKSLRSHEIAKIILSKQPERVFHYKEVIEIAKEGGYAGADDSIRRALGKSELFERVEEGKYRLAVNLAVKDQ